MPYIHTTMTNVNYQSIQVMRGIACLLVMAFHVSLQLNEYYGIEWPGYVFGQGYAGVDLFFVISGFVIAHSSHKLMGRPKLLTTYYIKRFVRIYPLYWLVMIPSIIGLMLTAPGKIPVGNPVDVFGHWVAVALLLPDHEPINAVSWSLSHELNFYLLFGLVIVTPRFWVIISLLIAGTVWVMAGLQVPAFYKFFFSPFNLEFGAGILVWYVTKKVKPSTLLSLISISIGLLICIVYQEVVTNENHTSRALVFGSASSLLLTGFIEMEKAGKFKCPRWLSRIGDASYVLYLFHLPYLIIMNKLIRAITPDQSMIMGLTICLFTSAIFFSIYLHHHVEKPLMNRLTNRFLSKLIEV